MRAYNSEGDGRQKVKVQKTEGTGFGSTYQGKPLHQSVIRLPTAAHSLFLMHVRIFLNQETVIVTWCHKTKQSNTITKPKNQSNKQEWQEKCFTLLSHSNLK